VNGVEVGRQTVALNTGSVNPLRIGKIIAVNGYYFTGDIAEIIVYNKALSDVEREEIDVYLSNKYGITLGGDTSPKLEIADMTVNKNGTFTIPIKGRNLEKISGFTLEIRYDVTKVGTDVSKGSLDSVVQFLPPFSGALKIIMENEPGVLLVNGALTSASGVDVSNGDFVNLFFMGKGVTALTELTFGDETSVTDEDLQTVVTNTDDTGKITLQ